MNDLPSLLSEQVCWHTLPAHRSSSGQDKGHMMMMMMSIFITHGSINLNARCAGTQGKKEVDRQGKVNTGQTKGRRRYSVNTRKRAKNIG